MTSAPIRDFSVPDAAMAPEGLSADRGTRLAPVTVFPAATASATSTRVYEIAKRALDITVSALLLMVLLPVFLATACLVGLTSPGPVFFGQQRCGRGGAKFTCYKFRTMVDGAEQMKQALLVKNEVTGPVFKIRNDPRVTPIGRLLRKTSIDELPQLLNVLRGDMSLVGPRPPLPEEVDSYTPRERLRLSVVPGITCLWQVSGRSNLNFDRWIELDLEYVQRRGFWFDAWLLLRTIPAVVTGRGAV